MLEKCINKTKYVTKSSIDDKYDSQREKNVTCAQRRLTLRKHTYSNILKTLPLK